ncbi:MAG: internal scaffolding protein [Microviridae sp.]|nr:MAG: internal scaffolding protein [Microviridae sp.]
MSNDLKSPTFRTPYDSSQPYYSQTTSLDFSVPDSHEGYHPSKSRTHQSFKDECDINIIVNNLDAQGFLDASRGKMPQYFDGTLVPDYHTALNQVIYAQSLFDDLPAPVRERFKNDPGAFIQFFNDPANQDEAIKLGLATARPLSPDASHEANLGSKATKPKVSSSSSSTVKKTVPDDGGN